MSADTDSTRPAAEGAVAAPLDLLLADAATGTQLLSGRQRFVLSTSGHVAAMVNPPDNAKASYQMAKQCPEDPQEWLRRAETCHPVLVA